MAIHEFSHTCSAPPYSDDRPCHKTKDYVGGRGVSVYHGSEGIQPPFFDSALLTRIMQVNQHPQRPIDAAALLLANRCQTAWVLGRLPPMSCLPCCRQPSSIKPPSPYSPPPLPHGSPRSTTLACLPRFAGLRPAGPPHRRVPAQAPVPPRRAAPTPAPTRPAHRRRSPRARPGPSTAVEPRERRRKPESAMKNPGGGAKSRGLEKCRRRTAVLRRRSKAVARGPATRLPT
jgi:hypothetical protein